MENKNKLWIIIIVVIAFLAGYIISALTKQNITNTTVKPERIVDVDTTYNKIVLDSIEYNITKKDSVIYHIKYKMKNEVTKVLELDDSAAVKLFKELASGN